ncbi:hypothetical protein HPB51_019593 [Rhipicephalus microplus]|uniref:Uncharacterized protein n=1 Tax=Rhipicephalus microplus TaxID=6941 RepID=A0A9J6EPZ7_RHIMP|nr:hypothetical protein HPB51_019593 [Rhipicephalus microplus]
MVKKSLPKPPLDVAGSQRIVVVTQAKDRLPLRRCNSSGNMGQQSAANRAAHLKGSLLPASCLIDPRTISELSFARVVAWTYDVSAVNTRFSTHSRSPHAFRRRLPKKIPSARTWCRTFSW